MKEINREFLCFSRVVQKKGQFNFVWIFALLVGAAILVLAIYGVMGLDDTARFQSDSEIAKSISIITDPLQAGFADGSFGKILFKQETRINNFCFNGGFGKNEISVETRSEIGEEWNPPGATTSIYNKYLFSSERNSGEEYYVFSKGFYFPYKVADLIFITSRHYCFVDAPDEITDEIDGMNIPNLVIDGSEDQECAADSVRVCFGRGSDCDISVYNACSNRCDPYEIGTVSKGSSEMEYVGSLMYGAIFSDEEIYNCNVERLMYRAGKIAEVFAEKSDYMNTRGCGTNLKSDLTGWGRLLMNSEAEDLVLMKRLSDDIDNKNGREVCGLW